MSDLLSENFDTTDGLNLSGYNGWAGDSADNIEIDTAQYKTGSASLLVNGTDTNLCYKSFTAQTTGKHTYDIWFRTSSIIEYKQHGSWVPANGVYVWSPANWAFILDSNGTSFRYWRTNTSPPNFGPTLVANTWYHLEAELDMDTDTFNVWVNDTQYLTNIAFRATGLTVDTITFDDNTAAASSWWDELRIYEGARGAAGGLSIPVILKVRPNTLLRM